MRVEVPEVSVDVGVLLEKTGQFVPDLKPDNFSVYENGVEQKIIGFKRVEAPITALLLCEFASTNYYFVYDMRNAAWSFAQQLRPQDYVAMMTFDMRTQIVTDFTQDKRQLYNAINSLIIPGFTDRNLFDALYEAEDRLSRIEGRKYIILIASGRDTFSKITLDKILQKVKNTPDITIFAVSTGGAVRAMTEGGPGFNQQMRDLDYLQADNQMKTFAKMTGGMWFEPRFVAEMPDIFSDINNAIRSKYEIDLPPHRCQTGRQLPQAARRARRRRGQAPAHAGREAQAAEVRHHRPRRLQGQAGSRVGRTKTRRRGRQTTPRTSTRPRHPSSSATSGLVELLDEVEHVVADHEQGGHARQHSATRSSGCSFSPWPRSRPGLSLVALNESSRKIWSSSSLVRLER